MFVDENHDNLFSYRCRARGWKWHFSNSLFSYLGKPGHWRLTASPRSRSAGCFSSSDPQFDVWEGSTQLHTTLGHISGSAYSSNKELVMKDVKTWQIHPVLQPLGLKVRTHYSFWCMCSRLSLGREKVMVEPLCAFRAWAGIRYIMEKDF